MADLTNVCNGLASVIAQIPGLRVIGQFASQVNPPAAIIIPQQQQVLKSDTFEGGITYFVRVILLVSYTEDASSVALINSYLATSGPSSLMSIMKQNPSLIVF
jgi:hypothetical protein